MKERGGERSLSSYLLLMTKAAMRMTTRTTLPATETRSTVGLVPSPMMGEGTGNRKGSISVRHPQKINLGSTQ